MLNFPAEPLARSDAANIQLDSADQVNVFLVAGELGPGGFVSANGSAAMGLLRSTIGARLDAADFGLRRFSQRVDSADGVPVWSQFRPDLNWHIRELPAYARPDGLAQLSAFLMTAPLPTDRPLWELLVIPRLGDDSAGVILRLHHCVADGVGAVELITRLFGSTSGLTESPSPPDQTPRRPADQTPSKQGLGLPRAVAMIQARIGPTPLLGRISQDRGVAFAEINLDALAAGARMSGGTINDALLAAVSCGVAASLQDCGAPVPATIRASIPVALPNRGGSGNATGVMVVDLPLRVGDSATLVGLLASQTAKAKAIARAQGTFELTRSRWGTWLFAKLARHQRFVGLFVTNVRGPSQNLTVAGAELRSLWPVAPIQGNIRLGVAAMSYAGQLSCAVHVGGGALSAHTCAQAIQIHLSGICALANKPPGWVAGE